MSLARAHEQEGGERGRGDQHHVSRNINWSFHNSRERKSAFHALLDVFRKQP